jgi:YegS/Rv2252/BmrU family lipid kinase
MGEPQKLIVILNGVSLKKKKFYDQILPGLATHYSVDVWETQHQEHALELGKKAAQEKPFGVLAAGGDGTLNQVLNGLFQANLSVFPTLGIIPLGTGNDFARLGSVASTHESIVKKIRSGGQFTDVGVVRCLDKAGNQTTRYFINVASLGMGPAVVHELFKSNRALGRDLTYLKSTLKVFFTHPLDEVEVTTPDWTWRSKARVVAIANGQSFGGGIYIAPKAKPDDGSFSTFVAGDIPLLKFLWILQQMKAKRLTTDSRIQYNSAKELTLTSPQPCWIETEGELAGLLPATIKILPNAIRFFR